MDSSNQQTVVSPSTMDELGNELDNELSLGPPSLQDSSSSDSSSQSAVEIKSEKYNLLFLLCDEFRFHPNYCQTPALLAWEKQNLPATREMKRTAVQFLQHYTSSMACAPARTTLFTGQYPSLHGVSQTDGAAKSAADPDMFWLNQATCPTLGSFLQEIGYRTFYKGKWHISNSDIIIPGTQDHLPSYNNLGVPNPRRTELYLANDLLNPFGFQGYVGPVPHGSDPRDSGSSAGFGLSGRDVVYSQEVKDLIQRLSTSKDNKPWCIIASLVNPHDITLYGEITKRLPTFQFDIDPSLPDVPRAPTADEILITKPRCQADYKAKYQVAFQPTLDSMEYRKLYYTLQKHMDQHMKEILNTLKESRFYHNTLVVYTSDHGDALGAHGLFQKWYSAYQETIHIPLYIRLPIRINQKKLPITTLTTHVDLLPTLLTLLNISQIEQKRAQISLTKTHSEVRHFVGQDLSKLVLAATFTNRKVVETWPSEPILFFNGDLVLTGPDNIGFNGQPYAPVIQPSTIQTMVSWFQSILYKFSKYYDPTDTSVEPQFEMYDLSNDPYEQRNLCSFKYGNRQTFKLARYLNKKLQDLYKTKALQPRTPPRIRNFLPRPS